MQVKNVASIIATVLSLIPIGAHASSAAEKTIPPKNVISVKAARQKALQAYPGSVKSEELEYEKGLWVYSFDLKKKGDPLVHEIQINALNGKLVSQVTESQSDEKKELEAEATEKK